MANLPDCYTKKSRDLIGRAFTASLERAIAAGDAVPVGREPLNLFWFAHHTVLMMVLTKLPSVPTLSYGAATRTWSGRFVNSFFEGSV